MASASIGRGCYYFGQSHVPQLHRLLPQPMRHPGMTHSGTDQCAATGAYTRSDAGVGATSNANQ